jgi:hypothetical protein
MTLRTTKGEPSMSSFLRNPIVIASIIVVILCLIGIFG